MLKRVITGIAYVVVVAGFFLLREFVDARLFNILICFFAAVGTFEVARAVNKYSAKGTFVISTVCGGLLVPLYCVGEYLLNYSIGSIFVLSVVGIGLLLALICCLVQKNCTKKTVLYTFLPYLYPALFIITMLRVNDAERGFTILLLSFAVSPLSDTLAYFVGSLFKGPKLCPKLSPKKTWSGAIGGTIGGILGAILVWLVFPVPTNYLPPVVVFIIAGVLGSVINVIGDLFESAIKRSVGIKDIGNILPGHGGIMDRIDGTSFVIALMYLLFLIF